MGRKRGGSPRRGGCKQAKSSAETFLEYKTFVDANVVVLTMPPLVIYAYRQLLAAKDMAGYQASKDRATFQSTMLDTLETDDDALANHIRIVREWAAQGGMLLNDFLNINRGLGGAK